MQEARQEVLEQCYPFLALSASIYIQHDARKAIIAAKHALQVSPGKEDSQLMQCILEAILKQLNVPATSILEQNNPANARYTKILNKLISQLIMKDQIQPQLRFLIAKSLVHLSNNGKQQEYFNKALDQIDQILPSEEMLSQQQTQQVKLERAKLLHNVGKSAEAKSQILQLIKKDPENEHYWVYLHIFTKNSEANMSK